MDIFHYAICPKHVGEPVGSFHGFHFFDHYVSGVESGFGYWNSSPYVVDPIWPPSSTPSGQSSLLILCQSLEIHWWWCWNGWCIHCLFCTRCTCYAFLSHKNEFFWGCFLFRTYPQRCIQPDFSALRIRCVGAVSAGNVSLFWMVAPAGFPLSTHEAANKYSNDGLTYFFLSSFCVSITVSIFMSS